MSRSGRTRLTAAALLALLPWAVAPAGDELPRVAGLLETPAGTAALLSWPNGEAAWLRPGESMRGCRLAANAAAVTCGDAPLVLSAAYAAESRRAPNGESFRIPRADWQRLLATPQSLVGALSLRPVVSGGVTEYWQVDAVSGPLRAPGGLREGDRLLALNGIPARDAELVMAEIRGVRDAGRFGLLVQRDGQLLTLQVARHD